MSDGAVFVWAQVAKVALSAVLAGIGFAITGALNFWIWFAIMLAVVFLGVLVIVHLDD